MPLNHSPARIVAALLAHPLFSFTMGTTKQGMSIFGHLLIFVETSEGIRRSNWIKSLYHLTFSLRSIDGHCIAIARCVAVVVLILCAQLIITFERRKKNIPLPKWPKQLGST